MNQISLRVAVAWFFWFLWFFKYERGRLMAVFRVGSWYAWAGMAIFVVTFQQPSAAAIVNMM